MRAAIRNVGLEFPIGRITVNLAPADEGRLIPFGRLPGAATSRSQPQEHVTSQCWQSLDYLVGPLHEPLADSESERPAGLARIIETPTPRLAREGTFA